MGILDIHEDIIQTHILTRLDGLTLASTASASSHLQSLCSDHKLWSNICSSNWPSTQHSLVTEAIVNFTSGHRSFFSDAYPSPSHQFSSSISSPLTSQFISAVDLRYHDQLVLSKVVSHSMTPVMTPFRVDLIEPKEFFQSELKLSGDDDVMQSNLEKYMTLSWILIDPTRNRAVNLSSLKAVSGQRNWLTDEIELTFGVVIAVDNRLESVNSHVICNVEVTCGVKGGGLELYVSGVSLTVQDVDGKCLNGKDSLVILQGLTVAERRQCGGEWWKEKYGEYIRRRKERKEMMERRERRLDLVRVAGVMAFLMSFWSLALY